MVRDECQLTEQVGKDRLCAVESRSGRFRHAHQLEKLRYLAMGFGIDASALFNESYVRQGGAELAAVNLQAGELSM